VKGQNVARRVMTILPLSCRPGGMVGASRQVNVFSTPACKPTGACWRHAPVNRTGPLLRSSHAPMPSSNEPAAAGQHSFARTKAMPLALV